jgi:hypothetical protein
MANTRLNQTGEPSRQLVITTKDLAHSMKLSHRIARTCRADTNAIPRVEQ